MIKIIPAKQNLGCLALQIADLFYVDTFQLWNGLRGFFINAKRFGRLWITPWRLSFRYEGYFFLQVRPFEKQHKKIYYRNNK